MADTDLSPNGGHGGSYSKYRTLELLQTAPNCSISGLTTKKAHKIAGFFPLATPSVAAVGRVGIEPTWCHHRRILSPLRLPIPPPARGVYSTLTYQEVKR